MCCFTAWQCRQFQFVNLQDHKPDLEHEMQRIKNEGGDVMEKAGIQRVVWKRPVTDRTAPVCRNTATEKIPFLAISRALGTCAL